MSLTNSLGNWWIKKRLLHIEHFKKNPEEVQLKGLDYLIKTAQNTVFGKKYYFSSINSLREFKEQVPVSSYEDLLPFINRTLKGEQGVLWPSKIQNFAKSSGTTSTSSKILPVSQESINNCHFQGGRDMLALYVNNYEGSKIFSGKNLSIGGNQESSSFGNSGAFIGNISAIVMKNLPFWAQYKRTPGLDITMMDSWEEKIKRMCQETTLQNVTSMAGSPMWVFLLLQHIFYEKKAVCIQEIWPNLEVFFHGSVSLLPYRPLFDLIDRNRSMRYLEVYNATEGFFGLQDKANDPSLLLMLDYNVFYEFIATEDFNSKDPKIYSLEEVELNRNYTLLISTNSGLWRYKLGDTIRFTELKPFRFIITGRTKHCLNLFGEDLFIEHAEIALDIACKQTGAITENYTAAPRYFKSKTKGCHEWVIEFAREPSNMKEFTGILDRELSIINADYKSKRKGNAAIEMPVVQRVAAGTFYNWLKYKDKLGGQHKIPRLSNSREFVEELLKIKPVTPSF